VAKYILVRTTNQQFRFTLHADNGENMLTSETYVTKDGALRGIGAVKVNAPHDSNYVRKISTRGLRYFTLKSANNNETLGYSEEYSSTQAMENAIATVKRIAPSAGVDDQT